MHFKNKKEASLDLEVDAILNCTNKAVRDSTENKAVRNRRIVYTLYKGPRSHDHKSNWNFLSS